ncbi:MAG: MltA domain-containing protein [Betaproteobacteria bacterium]
MRCSLRPAFCVVAAILVAACQVVPPAPVPVPPPTPPPAPAPESPRATFTPVPYSTLPGWADDDLAATWPAIVVGCRTLVANARTRATWERPCAAAERVDGRDRRAVRAYYEGYFSPYRIEAADGRDTGLVTGYYEPQLRGSRTPTAAFTVPLYAVPDDLLTVDLSLLFPELKDKRVRGRVDGKRVVPYWPRADIERGKAPLAGKALAYVAEPVDAFFLQIQGSGRIRLPDGAALRLGYADQNGHAFRSVARVLIERGELTLERASKQSIEAWGRANPDKLPALLDENPSYVFFREVAAPAPGSLEAQIDGPIGSLGVPLLAQRTIAVDPRAVPLGAPVFLATTLPLSVQPLNRLTLAQDTGGAIRGAVRADFFWGFGDDAGREAGRMRQDGRMWLLWPKDAPPPGP